MAVSSSLQLSHFPLSFDVVPIHRNDCLYIVREYKASDWLSVAKHLVVTF